MSFFNKKSASEHATQPDKPGSNRLALIILILLVAVFGYLYFFTSLIVPHGAPPAAPPAPPPQVKQAMPPRSTEVAATPSGEVKQQAPVPATPGAAASVPPASAPAPAAKTPPAAPAPAAKTPPVVAPAPASKAQPAAAPAAQKQAAPVPAKVDAKTVSPAKKVEQKQTPAVAGTEKKPADAKKPVKAAAPVKKKGELYTLSLGELPADQVSAAEAKFSDLKIKPVLKRQAQKPKQMNRLFYNAYNNYDAYSAELEKLKKLVKTAFAIERDGNYLVYAGSYGSAELARKEQKRLSAIGVKVDLQKAKLPISLVQISAGQFSSRADADRAAGKLRRQGLKVTVVARKR